MFNFSKAATAAALCCSFSAISLANEKHNHKILTPQSHAPIGVMGDHMHKAGEFMVSYRYMAMAMSGNRQGEHNLSSDNIATSVTNPFGMMPPTVRVVPQEMNTAMHMLGLMYAPTDDFTLMVMLNYLDKEMTLTTYQGMMGTSRLGNFNTESSGLADTKVGLLYRLHDDQTHHFHLNINWQIPTGDIEKTASVLTPMNTRITMRIPYAMQLGTGSNLIEIGSTYNGYANKSSWGAQVLYSTALEANDENYKVGDKTLLTAWYAQQLAENYSGSLRLSYSNTNNIDGKDENINAPVTTANPKNYGGDFIDIAIGLNTVLANKHRIAFEYQIPLKQDVNGVQMEMDNMFTLGYQLAF